MKTIRDMPDVRPGQLWADNDPRHAGRTLRVDEVCYRAGKKVARCTILTNSDETQAEIDKPTTPWYRPADRRGRQTDISVRRFRPTSTGYRLVTDVPKEG